MKGRPSVWRRIQCLAAAGHDAGLRRLAKRLAVELGVTPDELLAEAQAIAVRCEVAGAHTLEEQCALLAAEADLPTGALPRLWASRADSSGNPHRGRADQHAVT